jgi:hypothetical protein
LQQLRQLGDIHRDPARARLGQHQLFAHILEMLVQYRRINWHGGTREVLCCHLLGHPEEQGGHSNCHE